MSTITRNDPPLAATEKEMLTSFLDFHQATLLQKVEGLSKEQATRSFVPSGITLLGMVKHLAYVERAWFRRVFMNEEVDDIWTEDDPDADWRIEPDETLEQIVTLYQDEVDRAREIVANADLDEQARIPSREHTLRWILVHMIEETARHNGHADIFRELTDGQTGE